MGTIAKSILRLLLDDHAQDMIEYALLAGFLAVAAGALFPPVSTSISVILSKVGSVVAAASST